MAPPDFGRSVNPISTRGTDYSHLITTGTLGFSDLPTALLSITLRCSKFRNQFKYFDMVCYLKREASSAYISFEVQRKNN